MSSDAIPQTLKAKSTLANGEEISLKRHLSDTEEAAARIFRLDRRWGKNWRRFFRLCSVSQQEKFLLNLRVAALLHDIGKANEDFYAAVSKAGRIEPQTLRHEHIGALVLHLPEFRKWLAQCPALDLEVITAAVLSHHLKAEEKNGSKYCWGQPRGLKRQLRLYLEHDEVKEILHYLAALASLPEPPPLTVKYWSANALWEQVKRNGISTARRFRRELKEDKNRLELLLAVKAGVIVADAAASGLVREGHSIDEWIDEVVHAPAISGGEIEETIISKRARQIEGRQCKPFIFHQFQLGAAQQGDRVLLLAACAAGKTLAAWKWAKVQARKSSIGKVIFLYPTRGTATEGFRDYVGWAPEAEGAYVAGDAHYVLEDMASNPSDATAGKSHKLTEREERLFALGLWSRRYFSATVDQFLSFMEHSYTSLCLLPLLADSALIIDEVHSFDKRMFENLLAFLQTFDVPTLCMTATLTPDRRSRLEEAGLKAYPSAEEMALLGDLERAEKHPRYCHEPIKNAAEALNKAVAAFRKSQRVLWVVNTVRRCQAMAELLEKELGIKVLTYHSRYRLLDRQRIHTATVESFQQRDAAAIAVTTQVCEMSLDLDADVLITELAPISSLVQRFGRANRHLARGEDFRAALHTYFPESPLPYIKEELVAAEQFIHEVGSNEVSQWRLAELLEKHFIREPEPDGSARFLDSGYFATRGVFRDIEDHTRTCVLDDDLDQVKARIDLHKSFDHFQIGVPQRWARFDESRPDWLPKYLGIAPKAFYDPERGFLAE